MSVRTIMNNGASSNRIDIVFLGDGYTSSELATTYTNHANSLVSYLFNDSLLTQPFGRYESFFNVHLIDVASNQSGADNPGTGTTRDTALNSTYFYDGQTERLLYVDDTVANSALSAGLSGTSIDADMKFVTVNETKYGGGGGTYAVYAGGNASALEIAVHEVGHSFADLADEYGGSGSYSGSEPRAVNVTTDSSGSKWSKWLGYEQDGIGTIGAYEGGVYVDQGVYRPSLNSKMRSLEQPFDAISREAFVLEFYQHVDPLDSYSYQGTSGTLTGVSSLSVTPIDTDVITTDWYVNGTLTVSGKTSVTMTELGATDTAATYNISAKAYDTTDWVRGDRSSLEQTVSWTVQPTATNMIDTNDDTASTAVGTPVIIDVEANDTITFSDTVISSTNPSHGTLTSNSDRTYTYTPDAGFTGVDTFTYSVILTVDIMDTSTVRITVGDTADPANFTPLSEALTSSGLSKLRDFDGNALGNNDQWVEIGRTDIQGDGDTEVLLVNASNGRWATLGLVQVDGQDGIDFTQNGAGGDTRVVGIYIDPLVTSGQVESGGPFDSQTRFQNDLNAGRINKVLGSGDYDGDGMQEVYFDLADNSAVLHAYMHADGNIRYANYQSEADLAAYMTGNGVAASVYDGWF
jgi:hypothetical protein